jgi:hypothetical protein|tara:strand:+ start:67 stop:312 length:246 start_codon:yes stop_codon:yes gene_type:complete
MSKKIEKKELDQLKSQETEKAKLLNQIGFAEAQKHELLHAFAQIASDSRKFATELEEKYGKINVSLEDGSYEIAEEDGEAN